MAPEFRFPARTDIWVPIGLPPERYAPAGRFNQFLFTFARLKPGISFAQAESGVKVMSDQIVQNELKTGNSGGWGIFAKPFVDQIMGPLRTPMLVLLGAVGFVLLIAVSNIAGLLLERASSRSREVALRAALGASPWRLLRPAVAESLILATAGGVLGFLLSIGGVRLLMWLAPEDLVTVSSIRVDPWVLLFTAAITLGAGLLFGIAPAFQIGQSQNHNNLKEGGRSATSGIGRQHGRAILVTAEVALALVLLVGASLFLRSLGQLEKVDVGFEPRGVMSAKIGLPNARYPDDTQRIAFFRAVAHRLRSNPAVKNAGLGIPLPFTGDNWSGSFNIEGREQAPGQPGPHGDQRFVSPGYFNAMGIRLVKGRLFSEDDRENTDRVMVIDTVLAKTYWPDEDPIGKRVRRGSRAKPTWFTIVGIVEHVRHTELTSDTKGVYYSNALQSTPSVMSIVVEGRGVPGATLSTAIREAIQAVDPAQPVYDFKTMDERVSESLGIRRFAVRLLGFFASFALFMAALGLYGVISYAVTARTQEIGIRVALGAARGQVLSLVVGQGLRLAVAGVIAGLLGAYLLARTLESQLYEVRAFDPLTFLATSLILTAVAVCASALPAFRASRVDPIVALRHE
jgi:putative ABC transport system permease protein